MALKKDDAARVIVPTLSGTIAKVKYDEDTGEKRLLLEWTDAEGQHQERWFSEADLEPVPA